MKKSIQETLPLFPQLTPPSNTTPDLFALNLQMGLMVCAAVNVAVSLRLPDLLHTPKTVAVLARESGTHEPTLLALLQALTRIGVFEEINVRAHLFANTHRSYLLREGAMADLVRYWGAPHQWNSWRDLLFTVQTGKPALQKQHGPRASIWSYLNLHPQEGQSFGRGLSAMTGLLLPQVLDHYDFSELHHVVDVGAGEELLTSALWERYPTLKMTLFEQAGVIEHVADLLPKAMSDRCALVAGDFFQAGDLPQWADGYVYKNVLMDWSDKAYVQILSACYQAMDRTRGRVIVIEPLMSDDARFTPFLSLHMSMLMQHVRYRSLHEHRTLFEAAGFRLMQVRLLGLEYALLEGRPEGAEHAAYGQERVNNVV